jgi:glycyl-tRNA synthetase beta chain
MTSAFLLEIGTEEIPAGYLPPAAQHLERTLQAGLAERRIDVTTVRAFAAPRRLIVELTGLAPRQADVEKEVMGPAVSAAFGPDGALTKAGEGFARGQGVDPAALRRVDTPKGEYVAATVKLVGRPTPEVLLEWLPGVITGIPFPKTMKWRGESLRFARPVRWLVALLDGEVLPLRLEHLEAGRVSRGHRLFTKEPVTIETATGLLPALEAAGVLADPGVRRARVESEIARAAAEAGGRIVADADLIEEVTFLVEYPTAVTGSFDRDYLELPREVIITAMKAHQRYFAVEDASGALLPRFVAVANGRWADTTQVVAGNERVLRARLADARFYWDADRKAGLDARLDELRNVVWIEGAGTLLDRVARIERLTAWLGTAPTDSAQGLRDGAGRAVVDAAAAGVAARVARLAKADLATDMIKDGKEFTGLQGVIGGHYARAAGESEEVARGVAEHYQPRGPADALPSTVPGRLVSLADRLDTLAGCFAMGFYPTGSQDPYALRRAANGLVRILLESDWHVSLAAAVRQAIALLPESARERAEGGEAALQARLLEFLGDRLEYFLKEGGLPHDVAQATLAADADDPVDARARAQALAAIRGEADLEKLVVGFKRAANILKGLDEEVPPFEPSSVESAEPVERDLWQAVVTARNRLRAADTTHDYPAALTALLALRGPIDAFFEGVMVLSKNDAERRRRVALLGEVRATFGRLYDLSRIVVEG